MNEVKLKDVVITTGRRTQIEHIALAKRLAKDWGIEYCFRGRESTETILQNAKVSNIIVVKENRLTLKTATGEFFFHPNLAQIRIKNIRQNSAKDYMLDALNLQKDMSVLDCTMGFASDAIIESYAVGEAGKVVALEKNPLIAVVVAYGLKNCVFNDADLQDAMRRIEVVNADALEFLKIQKDNSFDAVYFDPMFRHPLTESENINPIREFAERAPVSEEMIKEAKRVARHRIVLKENARSLEFERLGFSTQIGGKYSKVSYGVMEKPL